MGRNKPRHQIKKDGTKYVKICKHCGWANCDTIHDFINTPYTRKVNKRKKQGECIACGKKTCCCKNKKGY